MPLNERKFGAGGGGEGKKKAGNIQCCIEATQVDGECEHKLLS